jgi:hypothetical protein
MLNTDLEIKEIQFKRGKKSVLEEKLVADLLGVPKSGEPIYETDTGKLKLGDGTTPYIDLPYFGVTGDTSNLPNFIIQDPLNSQVLLYDENLQAWVNKDLADKESIIYLAERGLTIKGYDEAEQGYMLVKDQTEGLAWVKPLDTTPLNNAVAAAETHKNEAANLAQQAGVAAIKAETAENNAKAINNQTMAWVNEKFWWGTADEYNEEISTNGLNPETFYFIRMSGINS